MVYDSFSGRLITAFKYEDKTYYQSLFRKLITKAAVELAIDENHIVIPVPMHYTRLIKRRYNQAAILASFLTRHTGARLLTRGISRRRRTLEQFGLSRRRRAANVRGAFQIHPRYKEILLSAHVILVDDVVTTGATANECARILKKAGVATVQILALARTPLD